VTRWRAASAVAFGIVFVGIGIALLVETAILGGGIGYLLGVLFIAAGAGRLYVTMTRRRPPAA
jgi:hypothetical protein